jgi:hypothetical protein
MGMWPYGALKCFKPARYQLGLGGGSVTKIEQAPRRTQSDTRPARRDCAEGDSVIFTQHHSLRRQWLAGLVRDGAQRLWNFFRENLKT